MNSVSTDRSFERRISVAGSVTLDVRLESGAVKVKPGGAGAVEIRGVLRAPQTALPWRDPGSLLDELAQSPPVAVDGDTIRIGEGAVGLSLKGALLLLEVSAPPETGIRFQSDSADLHVEGLRGSLDCETGHGHLDLLGIGGEARISTDHGAVTLSHALAAPVRITTDHGDITVHLSPNRGYNIAVETDHGRLRLPPLENLRSDEGRIRGVLRGGGPLVELRTDAGYVAIE